MTASTNPKAPALTLHPLTAEAVRQEQWETAAQLHCLAGIRDWDPDWLDRHVLPDGRPLWDTIDNIQLLSTGEEVLRDVAWELGGHRPQHGGVVCRLSWLDDPMYGRVVEALALRRGLRLAAVPDVEEGAA